MREWAAGRQLRTRIAGLQRCQQSAAERVATRSPNDCSMHHWIFLWETLWPFEQKHQTWGPNSISDQSRRPASGPASVESVAETRRDLFSPKDEGRLFSPLFSQKEELDRIGFEALQSFSTAPGTRAQQLDEGRRAMNGQKKRHKWSTCSRCPFIE